MANVLDVMFRPLDGVFVCTNVKILKMKIPIKKIVCSFPATSPFAFAFVMHEIHGQPDMCASTMSLFKGHEKKPLRYLWLSACKI